MGRAFGKGMCAKCAIFQGFFKVNPALESQAQGSKENFSIDSNLF